jgi:crotonobetainyl-CoA:carnitine CoA-transferase CaiB-like acyl-CoA transferase
LTVLAASGLLDIFGEPGSPPLPLPGHQIGYAAGLAAFNAFICAHFAHASGQPYSNSRVSVLDVALWLNWKHYLGAYLHLPNVGIGRAEEWKTYQCRDGFVAFVFQDKDLGKIAALTGEARFNEPRFATHRGRRENIDAFGELIARWVREQTRDEIVAKARNLGLPIGPVLKIGELLGDEQMLAREFIDLAGGSPTFGLPRLPVLWRHPGVDAKSA